MTTVPRIVARGIVRSGILARSSAGTVADSRPMNAHSVSVAAAETAPKSPSPLVVLNGVKLPPSMKNSPMHADDGAAG